MTAPRLVLLGTGTGVGKTHVGVALLRAAARRGLALRGCKPIETGCVAGRAADADALEAAGATFHVQHTPVRLVAPLAAPAAARAEGVPMNVEAAAAYARAVAATGPALVETAGGLFSPLGAGRTNWDLARALDPAVWVLVAPDRLGVLHDLTAALGWARALGRAPDLVVLSAPEVADSSTGTNAAEALASGLPAARACFPREAPDGDASDQAAAAVLAAAGLCP